MNLQFQKRPQRVLRIKVLDFAAPVQACLETNCTQLAPSDRPSLRSSLFGTICVRMVFGRRRTFGSQSPVFRLGNFLFTTLPPNNRPVWWRNHAGFPVPGKIFTLTLCELAGGSGERKGVAKSLVRSLVMIQTLRRIERALPRKGLCLSPGGTVRSQPGSKCLDSAASKEPSRRVRSVSRRCAHRFDDWSDWPSLKTRRTFGREIPLGLDLLNVKKISRSARFCASRPAALRRKLISIFRLTARFNFATYL
jgi:hypothetical protein